MSKRIIICTDIPEEVWEVFQTALVNLVQAASRGKFAVMSGNGTDGTAKLISHMLIAEEQIAEWNAKHL